MLNEEICKLRNKLNESIVTGKDYSIIYQLSIELDELIAEYYRRNKIWKKYFSVDTKLTTKLIKNYDII